MKITTINIGQISQREFEITAVQGRMRDRYTDGKFVTREEYTRLIRKLKLKEIYKY